MADEIVFQSPGITIAISDEGGGCAPYPAVRYADGECNYGYFDLINYPTLIDDIPELKKSPGLKSIIMALNQPGSPLMSIGCEVALFPRETSVSGEPSCYYGSYTNIVFRDLEQNRKIEKLVSLAKNIHAGIERNDKHVFGFEMIVEPLKFLWNLDSCFTLNIKILAYGNDADSAGASFKCAAMAVADRVQTILGEEMKISDDC